MKKNNKGFTLIELVLVVAILAIIAVVAVGKFGDLRKAAARKTNLSSIANIHRAIDTKIAMTDKRTGMFNYLESLIDVKRGGGDTTGAAGTYEWSNGNWYDGSGGVTPGIYCGIKQSEVTYNASGVTTGAATPLEEAHENNKGLDTLQGKLGMYYLKDSEVASLKEMGIQIVLRHNFSTAQSRAIATLDSNSALTTRNGGPGHRADLSAFYPVVLTNGSAVAVLNPATCSDIYRLLGQSYGNTNGVSGVSASTPETYFSKGVCKRLLVFGMGRSSDITTALFETPPRCEVLDKTYYRNYLLVFSMNNGSGNSGTTVEFVGVIDPQGNTAAAAQYNIDWAS